MSPFVDTCFLMNEVGRQYLLASGLRFTVILTVKNELERLADKEKNVKAAQDALAFMSLHTELFDWREQLPEERDIKAGLREEQEILADSVFRRIAIRCADEQVPVHFLTADWALAEALGLYAAQITYLDRQHRRVADWHQHRKEAVELAKENLLPLLRNNDIVLSSSGMQSPFLLQFLRNVQSMVTRKDDRLLVHSLSLEKMSETAHLSLEILDLLENGGVASTRSCETPYQSESAMLDAMYYARSAVRRVTVVVSGWHEVVQRYDARSHAAEPDTDPVNFMVITAAGGLMPLLNAWQLRKLSKPVPVVFPVAPALELPTGAETMDYNDEPVVENSEEAAVRLPDIEEEVSSVGSHLAQLVKAENLQAVLAAVGENQQRLSLAILYALRWGRTSMLQELVPYARELSPYCFDNWFKKSPKNTNSLSCEQLLSDDFYYEQLRSVVRLSRHFSQPSPSVSVLVRLASQGAGEVSLRARAVLEMLRSRGVLVDESQPVSEAAKEIKPMNCENADKKFTHLFHQQMEKMKMGEFVEEIRKNYRPADLPAVLSVAIKVARRRNRPAMVTALLNLFTTSIPSYCFAQWFSRSKSNDASPRARDLMLRKYFFDLTRRIIAKSEDLSACGPAMQVLLTLQQDSEEIVRTRARELQELAAARGAPVIGKVK